MQLVVLMDPHEDTDDILRANRSREKRYVFDHVFSSEATQEDVYHAVIQGKGIIESVLNGYNCTVFAYGATGKLISFKNLSFVIRSCNNLLH